VFALLLAHKTVTWTVLAFEKEEREPTRTRAIMKANSTHSTDNASLCDTRARPVKTL
jgi:hypothetical protein